MRKVLVTLWVTVEVEDHVDINNIVVNSPTKFWLMGPDENTEYDVLESDQVSEEDITDSEE